MGAALIKGLLLPLSFCSFTGWKPLAAVDGAIRFEGVVDLLTRPVRTPALSLQALGLLGVRGPRDLTIIGCGVTVSSSAKPHGSSSGRSAIFVRSLCGDLACFLFDLPELGPDHMVGDAVAE